MKTSCHTVVIFSPENNGPQKKITESLLGRAYQKMYTVSLFEPFPLESAAMKTTYNPHDIESHCYAIWENQGYFQPSGHGEPYCIMLPPPNVTGTLHMGHGFQMTLMDALIRYHRMLGRNTLWQAGTDHAGIATQMVVERQLQQEGITRQEIGRKEFIERVWEWKNKSDGIIKQQMRRLGVSVDWTRERFTLDESISRAVIEVFVHLYEEGLIYRGNKLVNWDPVLLTAVSDLEVVIEEQQGHLWHIRYPLTDSNEYIVVATTRPETLFGDVAVAVNPNDARYQKYIGKSVKLPLTDRIIPIIADEMVDMEFGTGCVKITPAHDFNDYSTGQRHNLPLINIFTPDAHLNSEVPKNYQSLERFRAREQVVKDLQASDLIEKIETHTSKIPRGDRSNAIIEPYLTNQWFVSAKNLAEPAITAVKKNQIKFVPEHWTKIYFQWLEKIEDWCISRQLWWGHRIPAWYDSNGKIFVGRNEAEVRKKNHLGPEVKLKQDDDVLDTWFSSGLWPFATLGWPEETAEFKTFYPTNVLVTGFDIIFFWVARMIMLGMHFTGKVPFREVYITGLIRDSEGQKMSKSKGNIIDPIDLIDGISLEALIKKRTSGLIQPQMAKRIEQNTRKEFPQGIPAYGTDALRFTFCALASPGREIRFDLGRLEGYRNFCNKIWNAARFVIMNVEKSPLPPFAKRGEINANSPPFLKGDEGEFSLADRWIRSRLQKAIEAVTTAFTDYRFDFLSQAIYEFIWNEFCDWYLELTKPLLYSTILDEATKQLTRHTLIEVLENILRLIHPIMPFITEEIWQQVAPFMGNKDKTIMLQSFPKSDHSQIDNEAEKEMAWLQKIIISIRNIRGEMNISPKISLPLLTNKGSNLDRQRLQKHRDLLMTLAKITSIEEIKNNHVPPSTTAIIDELELHIPMENLIDKETEISRLKKEIAKQHQDLEKVQMRLNNPNYLEKAPAAVVNKEQARAKELQLLIDKLQQQIARIKEI